MVSIRNWEKVDANDAVDEAELERMVIRVDESDRGWGRSISRVDLRIYSNRLQQWECVEILHKRLLARSCDLNDEIDTPCSHG